MRLDGKALRAAPLYAAAMEALGTIGARAPLDQLSTQCGFSIPEAIDEVLLAGSDDSKKEFLLVARVGAPGEAALACLGKIAQGSSGITSIADKPAIRLPASRVAVWTSDLLIAGRPHGHGAGPGRSRWRR